MLTALLMICLTLTSQISYSKCPSYAELTAQIGKELDFQVTQLYYEAAKGNIDDNCDTQRVIVAYDSNLPPVVNNNKIQYYVSSMSVKSKLADKSIYSYASLNCLNGEHPFFAMSSSNSSIGKIQVKFEQIPDIKEWSDIGSNLCTYALQTNGDIYGFLSSTSKGYITKKGISYIIKIILRTKKISKY